MLKKSDDFHIALLNYRNTPPKGHTYSPTQRMVNRRTLPTLPTPDHLLTPTAISSATVTEEIKTKRNASKVQYDKTAGREHNAINIGEFVYARPPPRQSGNPWAYGCVTDKHRPRSYTIKMPSSTIRRNRIHVRRAAPPPPPPPPPPPLTPTHMPLTLLPSTGHSPVYHHNPQGSVPNTSTDQPKQLTLPYPSISRHKQQRTGSPHLNATPKRNKHT